MHAIKWEEMGAAAARPATRRTGGRSARVRRAVVEATLEVLAARDVDGLSVTEVARRAGVHPTTIYRRWGDPVNLALDAVLSRTDAEVPTPDTGTLRGDLIALLHGIADFLGTPLGEVLVRLAQRPDRPDLEAARGRFWVERFEVGAALLQRAEARGEVRPGLDPVLALEALIGPMVLRRLLTREPLDATFISQSVDLLLGGIGGEAPPGTP